MLAGKILYVQRYINKNLISQKQPVHSHLLLLGKSFIW